MSHAMRASGAVAAFASGVLFGVGLLVAGMTHPSKVLGFLDVFGAWDGSLLLVMTGAIAVSAPLTQWIRRRQAPYFQRTFAVPTSLGPWRSQLDARLIGGAVLFGTGWGLSGYCPGPALVSLPSAFDSGALNSAAVFTAAMLVGMLLFSLYDRLSPRKFGLPAQRYCDVAALRGTLADTDDTRSSIAR